MPRLVFIIVVDVSGGPVKMKDLHVRVHELGLLGLFPQLKIVTIQHLELVKR